MGVARRGRSRRAAAAALFAGILLLAACGGDDEESPGQAEDGATEDGGDGEEITLTLDTFSEFGYEELIEQYQEDNPNVTIEHRKVGTLDEHRTRTDQYIAAGGEGAGDVVALEAGQMVAHRAFADNYVDLLEYGAGDVEDDFLPWKWTDGMTADGQLIGLGTDVGPMVMAYRTDLFEQAGLPTDREEVSALWPTWEEYLAVGEQFEAAGTGAKFLDSLTQVWNAVINQSGDHNFFDTDENLVIDSNPIVTDAWDLMAQMHEADLSAALVTFQEDWEQGFRQDAFATVPSPAWMLGNIEDASGEEKAGLWDVAAVPGGGGNWGGSFLSVPATSEHPQEAADLAMFLTSPESHIVAFEATGNFPSSVTGLEDGSVQGSVREYFNNAPVGELLSESAQSLQPIYLGANHQPVREEVDNILRALEQGSIATPDEAWTQAVEAAQQVAE
jgi:cellobiose transport system substrate-binding protein